MAATDFVWTRIPVPGEEPSVKNTSGTAMTAGQCVKLDTANPLSGTQPVPGVVLTSAVTDVPFGILIDNIPAGGYGRCARSGQIQAIAAGAIAAGAQVGPSAATSGDVTTYTAGDPSLGQALNVTANAGDPVVIALALSKNG